MMMRRSVAALLLCLACTGVAHAQSSTISLTRTLLYPGQATTAITVAWQSGTYELRAPAGFVVDRPARSVTVEPGEGAVVRWRVEAGQVAPGQYPFVLWVDGEQVASVSVDVCCIVATGPWRSVWLPMIQALAR